ncbi:LpqB family beta-propeller domain-containing protein [Nocardiopsis kunsanensis]|uniref:Lipoprotein LpqB n=1 Tax=Nocardiopsis kunsanensis TaxID=141693 RepID=A0A919CFF2_9ACTN|nr:LpqB family beta-propeller domain-containing protein [Nocardiopsis kunsanensis]GHD18286.1 lipoprotein LpqB [Nocardiopsis kunsanensis]
MRTALGRRTRSTLTAAAACVLLASCSGVPTTGPVVPGDGGDVTSDPYGGYVRLLPAGPQPGVTPEGLVNGFLKDMGSFEENHKAARSYMLPGLEESWSPDGSVQIFRDLDTVDLDPEISPDGLTATVSLRSSLVATIDQSGKYAPNDDEGLFEATFQLARENGDPDGEWRIQDMPDELILSELDVERTHRPFNLYYFNPEGTALVPDPVYLPVSNSELAERLLTKLMDGPSDWLGPAVRSAFPEDAETDLEVDNESAAVDVDTEGEDPDTVEMGAQVAWTLRQIPDIQEFTLRVDGTEVDFPGTEGESEDRPRPGDDFWAGVSPSATTSSSRAYYSHDGQLWSAGDWENENFDDVERVAGPLGAGDVPIETFALSMDESTVAGITLGGGQVVTSFVSPGAEYETVLDEGVFTEVSWDVNGHLWVVEETEQPESDEDEADRSRNEQPTIDGEAQPPEPGDSALWLLRGGDEVVRVGLPELRDRSLVDFQISRDGTRAAAITEIDGERSLEVGRVVADGDQVAVGGFIPLASELEDIIDVSWRSGDQLAILGSREGGTSQAFLVPVDGGSPPASTGSSLPGMVAISGAPGQPLIAGADDGSIWVSNDRLNWQSAVEGVAPTFPG